MPAMIGIASVRLLPFTPWQAEQVITLASGVSKGPPVEAGPCAHADPASTAPATPARATTAVGSRASRPLPAWWKDPPG